MNGNGYTGSSDPGVGTIQCHLVPNGSLDGSSQVQFGMVESQAPDVLHPRNLDQPRSRTSGGIAIRSGCNKSGLVSNATIQLLLGLMSFGGAVLGTASAAHMYAVGVGYWGGVSYIVSGIIAFSAMKNAPKGLVIVIFFATIVTLACAGAQTLIGFIGLDYDMDGYCAQTNTLGGAYNVGACRVNGGCGVSCALAGNAMLACAGMPEMLCSAWMMIVCIKILWFPPNNQSNRTPRREVEIFPVVYQIQQPPYNPSYFPTTTVPFQPSTLGITNLVQLPTTQQQQQHHHQQQQLPEQQQQQYLGFDLTQRLPDQHHPQKQQPQQDQQQQHLQQPQQQQQQLTSPPLFEYQEEWHEGQEQHWGQQGQQQGQGLQQGQQQQQNQQQQPPSPPPRPQLQQQQQQLWQGQQMQEQGQGLGQGQRQGQWLPGQQEQGQQQQPPPPSPPPRQQQQQQQQQLQQQQQHEQQQQQQIYLITDESIYDNILI